MVKPARPPVGVGCPKCASDSRVYKTRSYRKLSKVIRTRECLSPDCRYRFKTEETFLCGTRPERACGRLDSAEARLDWLERQIKGSDGR